ncbi:MAG: hypothetical protein LBN00_12170 [Oscillospiraceae bacterium]|jgi:hypothetical protein|nr:hypothetical protein [Oscillospiraceae bacterium]
MNIYDFISSRDVREHCVKIGHEFTIQEQAVVICHSGKTLDERLDAYRELIPHARGAAISGTDDREDDLAEVLEDIIADATTARDAALAYGENCVYYDEETHEIFRTFAEARQRLTDLYKNVREYKSRCHIYRREIGSPYPYYTIRVNANGEILRVLAQFEQNVKSGDGWSESYLSRCISHPTPFRQGDIVTCGANGMSVHNSPAGVLEGTYRYMVSDDKTLSAGDYYDMGFRVKTIVNGEFCIDQLNTTLDIEFFRGELPEHLKPLKELSERLKGYLPPSETEEEN